MIFRNDDVNPNSNIDIVLAQYAVIAARFPDAKIWSAVNVFGKTSEDQSAYPKLLPKDIDGPAVDRIFDTWNLKWLAGYGEVVSHGLWHIDHATLTRDLQEYSIRSSCDLLKTHTFIPPFWRWNADTIAICVKYGIDLPITEPWINFERNPVDPGHEFYLWHSWRYVGRAKEFAEKFV